jgi:hypothetical protein
VALEHHLHFKRPGGFPPLFTNRLGVFTRIVQVADHYDAMVAPDATTKNSPFLPAKAMRKIMQGAGVRFDPVVVKAFVQVMGRHPYGSLVKLNTREMAIVMGAGRPGEGFKRPPIRIVRAADGAKMNNAVDLLDEEHHDRWIIRALDPVAKGIDINSYLFGEYAEISEIMEGVDPPAPRGSTAEESSPEASQETTPEPSQGFMPPRVSKPPPKEVFRSPPRAKAPREPQAEPAPEPEEEPVQWVVDSVEEDEDEVTLDIEY